MKNKSDLKNIKELALKLKEMASRGGTENERSVAEKKLSALLSKYGLTIKDISDKKLKQKKFKFKHEDEVIILTHVIWSVVPKVNILRRGKRKEAFCELTPEQYIEAKEKVDFYLKHYAEEKKNFTIAYIFKNNLEVQKESESESKNESKIEFDSKSVIDMMRAINHGDFVSNKKKKLISK